MGHHGEDNKNEEGRETPLKVEESKEIPEKKPEIHFSYRNQYGENAHASIYVDDASKLIGELMTFKHQVLNKSRDLTSFIDKHKDL